MLLRFRKSTYSTSQDNCVEVATIPSFRKSTYSSSQENCVEVAPLPSPGSALRDSKCPEAGFLAFHSPEWVAFLHAVKERAL